jgi:hypothetical protein
MKIVLSAMHGLTNEGFGVYNLATNEVFCAVPLRGNQTNASKRWSTRESAVTASRVGESRYKRSRRNGL